MVDYRKHLGKKERVVLPFFRGLCVEGRDGSFRLGASVEPGYHLFEIRGRVAYPVERAEAPDLAALNKVRGHLFGNMIVLESAMTELLHFPPDGDLPRFSPVVARRWHSGDLLFDSLDLEANAEEVVRRRFEDRGNLAGIAGIPATLRASFGYSVVARESERLGIPFLPVEVRRWILPISEEGAERATACLQDLRRHREAYRHSSSLRVPTLAARGNRLQDRVEASLRGTGARLCDLRCLAGGLLEVRYEFLGSRFAALVREGNLQVVDAGICLDGSDSALTLGSLPGTIREAMDSDQLVVTWHEG